MIQTQAESKRSANAALQPVSEERHGGGGTPDLRKHSEAVVRVASTLHEMLQKLLELAEEKLSAMRAADAAALRECAERECATLEELFGQEKERDATLARLAQSLHWNTTSPPKLSHVAEKIPEPYSSRLRALNADLRATAEELKKKNRLAAETARRLHIHVRAIFEEVANVNRETIVYGPNGRHESRTTKTWVDAVG